MLVRMKTRIGGYRNGEPWPAPGGTIDVPAHEAHGLIANGYAVLEHELADGDVVDEVQAVDETANVDADETDNDEEQADDWSFAEPARDGDEEASEDGDAEASEDGDEEASADEVTGDASPTVPTGARKPRRR